MVDANLDDRADGVALTYNEPINHLADADGSYPFFVSGYAVSRIDAAANSTRLLLRLTPKTTPDIGARPPVTYTRTANQPVKDRAGNQAVAQTFSATAALDTDGDGFTRVGGDCVPTNASIRPGAVDIPDPAYIDSNCDGIDGDVAQARFVAPVGADGANCGTRANPCATPSAAVAAAEAAGVRDVYLSGGTYPGFRLADGVHVFGGFGANFQRKPSLATGSRVATVIGSQGVEVVPGDPQAVTVWATDLTRPTTLADLTLVGADALAQTPAGDGAGSYVVVARAAPRDSLTITRNIMVLGKGAPGRAGRPGTDASAPAATPQMNGSDGQAAGPGSTAGCDDAPGAGGLGGTGTGSAADGGGGGLGGARDSSCSATPEDLAASAGGIGGDGGGADASAGRGGNGGTTCQTGGHGENAAVTNGTAGQGGAAGALNGAFWYGSPGTDGGDGTAGTGGGGGGGGGGCDSPEGFGGGGGAGGAGGAPATGGAGGRAGGGSFGIFLIDASPTVTGNTLSGGTGGSGGNGGTGGAGQSGGAGGAGGAAYGGAGAGGDGGHGAHGGHGGGGGGGAGGAWYGIYGTSSTSAPMTSANTFIVGTPASGGHGGASALTAPAHERDGNAGTNGVVGAAAATGGCATPGNCLPTGPPAGVTDWPMWHNDQRHSGLSPETTLNATNAGGLAVRWKRASGASQVYASPVVAWAPARAQLLVYIGAVNGIVGAYDPTRGDSIWTFRGSGQVYGSAAVAKGVVYVGIGNRMYALDASTGSQLCRSDAVGTISSSPVVVDPDGTGAIVYFGDNGPGGANDGGAFWAMNAVDDNAARDCSMRWSYKAFGDPPGSHNDVGSWSPPAFGVDGNGRPLVVFGGSSPEAAVYALDARDGSRAWRFKTLTNTTDQDVGAGPTISPPGVNGFPDGAVYVAGKNNILYALNLRTGAPIWQFSIKADLGSIPPGATRSTAALAGNRLYLGYSRGVYAINAVTGAKVWRSGGTRTDGAAISSPAVTGAPGSQVVVVGDLNGQFRALRASDGALLYKYQLTEPGAFIYSSPAISGGAAFIGGSDGNLYAFALPGGASAQPATTIGTPADGSMLANNGTVAVTGNAQDDRAVNSVLVAVHDTNIDQWWNGLTATWSSTFVQNTASLASPGAKTSAWTLQFPVSANGGPFTVTAQAVDSNGQHDPQPRRSAFGVVSLTDPPDTAITEPTPNAVYSMPQPTASIPITVRGTAVDTAGMDVGVQRVFVVVRNRDHNEYYCAASCPGGAGASFSPTFAVIEATVDNPGSGSVNWNLTFPSYDHEHPYEVTAWAVDNEGNPDPFRARVARFCVNVADNPTC